MSVFWFTVGAALAAWPAGDRPALDGPVQGLAFGMDADAVWAAIPKLRSAVDLRLDVPIFDAFVAAHPAALEGRYPGEGGNRWVTEKSLRSAWPEVDGVKWSVEVQGDLGLSRVRVHFPSEASADRALARWGAPAHAGRWKVWLGDGIRAAYTGCFRPSDGPEACTLELMPYAPVEAMARDVVSVKLGTARDALPAGIRIGERAALLPRTPYEISSGYVPLEITWDEAGAVVATRTQLDFTYDTSQEKRIRDAIEAALGPPDGQDGACKVWTSPPARACDARTTVRIEIGERGVW